MTHFQQTFDEFALPARAWLRAYLHALNSAHPVEAQAQADLAETLLRNYMTAHGIDGPGEAKPITSDELTCAVGPVMRGIRPPFPNWQPEDYGHGDGERIRGAGGE